MKNNYGFCNKIYNIVGYVDLEGFSFEVKLLRGNNNTINSILSKISK